MRPLVMPSARAIAWAIFCLASLPEFKYLSGRPAASMTASEASFVRRLIC
jgi:hypothetical protein